jgi:hypothetical protein
MRYVYIQAHNLPSHNVATESCADSGKLSNAMVNKRINLVITSTQLPSINSVFVLTNYMFRPCFCAICRWYIRLNLDYPNRNDLHFKRKRVPCS